MKSHPIRVFCVEDDAHDRELIRHALEKEAQGFVVTEAADRKTFESLLTKGDFDMVLTDFNILGFEGLEVISRVNERHPGVPVIVVTGTGSEEVAVQALKQGAEDYVIKTPPNIAHLPITIQRVLEAKRTRDELREMDGNYRSLVANTADGILVVDRHGNILFSNPVAEQLLGSPAQGLVGQAFGYPIMMEKPVDMELPHRTGGPGTAEMRVAEVQWNRRPCQIVSLRDMTERKQAEEERDRLVAQLVQAQRLESVGRLAGGVAHDFNNLLTTITGNAEMALLDTDPADPNYEMLGEIKESAERAARLTRQLLAFSRKQVLQPEILDLNEVVGEIHKMLVRLIGEDIRLETVLAPDLGRVEVDPGQMEQVMMNLAVNARDAMPDGGKLTIETVSVALDRAYTETHGEKMRPGLYVMLAVTDTGAGMSPETQAQAFEPFFTTKEKGTGTGLGLSMVYGIIKQSKGNISVYSEPGKGTTFKVYLPKVEAETDAQPRETREPEQLEGSETILVVEDEESVRRIAYKTLRQYGYTVLTAASGDEALALFERHQKEILLLITDLIMPGMTGGELAEKIKDRSPAMKVLYMSGYTDKSIVRSGFLTDENAFLQKPFNTEGLVRKVRQLLAG